MRMKLIAAACCAAAAVIAAWGAGGAPEALLDALTARMTQEQPLRLYGSVDTRTVRLAFEETGRLAELLVEEGAFVHAGDVVARIDDERQRIALGRAEAALAVARRSLELAEAGARKEDVAAARARLSALRAAEALSGRTCARERRLGSATSPQRVDQACSQAVVDRAQAEAAARELERLEAGTRPEEVAVRRAEADQAAAAASEAERALKACTLVAPSDMVVRSRLREPGDMVSPTVPVVEGALTNPLWVRAWVDEVNLDRVVPGEMVRVTGDSRPERSYPGTVGFVSTVAEFTPKSVQTESVRTSLVYEVRITLEDPRGELRLGMPVTVSLPEARERSR